RSHVQEDVQANVLAAIPIADAQIRRDLALVFRKDKALSRAALAFIDTTVRIKNPEAIARPKRDRKSTRLNSSHGSISYAVFCLKKKKDKQHKYHIHITRHY